MDRADARLEWLRMVIVLMAAAGLLGCAPVISPQWRAQADPALAFAAVQQKPNQYKGKIVIWSGTIIAATNTQQGTMLEVLEHEADSRGKPVDPDRSDGRFLALDPRFLDTAIYAAGRQITVAGEIQGSRTRPMGEINYRYPYLHVKELYLWPKEEPYRSPYYDPYYYDRPIWWNLHIGTGWWF